MRLFSLFLIGIIFAAGCASSEKNSDAATSYPNLVELKQPQNEHEDSKVYVDSVSVISVKQSPALLIQGSFPDGCTHLKVAEHTQGGESMGLTLKAWRDSESYCTQALTSFSFIYDGINPELVSNLTSIKINGRSYKIQ